MPITARHPQPGANAQRRPIPSPVAMYGARVGRGRLAKAKAGAGESDVPRGSGRRSVPGTSFTDYTDGMSPVFAVSYVPGTTHHVRTRSGRPAERFLTRDSAC